jgi:ribosomal protein S18 acetylase RimI-like enzyme
MVVTAAEGAEPVRGALRPMNPTRDLGSIVDLMSDAFAQEMDERARAALREMRWMARMPPLVWWWSQADPSFQDTFNGFVWEEPSPTGGKPQIVGNVNLNRAPGNRRRYIICNVVVHKGYRGQGIGRQLMEAAIAEAEVLGAEGVVLQVHQDNLSALRLYLDLGFHEVTGETQLRLLSAGSVAVLDAPGYHLRSWQPADGQAVHKLALATTSTVQQWLRPVKADDYQLSLLPRLVKRLIDLLAGRRVYRLVALQDDRLLALLTLTVAFRQGDHRLELMVDPEHHGRVEAALISRALHTLAAGPPGVVRATAEKGHAAIGVLRNYGFEELRTLLTLRREGR